MTWVFYPGHETESPSAQEVAALIWASCLPSPDSTPDALSNGNPTLDQPSSPHNGRDTSPRPRSGPTSQPLMQGPSLEPSTPLSPGIHASHSAWQESGWVRPIPDTFGPMLQEWPANSVTASDGSSLRTSPDTSALALKPCCENYGTWAQRLRLAYSQRAKLARRTKGNAGSAWPTARGEDSESAGMRHSRGVADTLTAVTSIWPTPMAGTPAQNGNSMAGNNDFSQKGAERPTLEGQGANWPTASASMVTGAGSEGRAGGLNLQTAADKWPTPAARDTKGENSPDHLQNGTGRLHLDQLPNAVAFLYSRPAPETVTHGPTLSQLRPIWHPLRASVIASHGRATWRRLWTGRAKRRLNPTFVGWLMGWLMGWPPGHALCDCSETEFTHWQQDMRGALSLLPTASGPWIWQPPETEAPTPTQISMFGEG